MVSTVVWSFFVLITFAVVSGIYMYLREKKMQSFNGKAKITGVCGDTMQIFLKFENGTVNDAHSSSDGCGISKAAAQVAANLAMNKSPEEVATIDFAKVQAAIGQLPKDHEHCALLASMTLQRALENYLKSNRL